MTDDIPRFVIFDMDGVITDSMPYHYRAWSAVFRELGLVVPKHEIYRREGQKGIVSVREILAGHGMPFSIKRGRSILARKEVIFQKIARVRFINGARSFIMALKRRSIAMAIVTGTSRHEVERILSQDLLGMFSIIVSGSDVRNGKPHPEPYRKAMKALGVSKGEGVVIENAPLGIQSAKAAGLACFAIETSLPRRYLERADRVFRDFRSLRRFFRQRYGL